MQQVEQTPVEQRQAAVGLLTTEHRDTWGPVSHVLWQTNILTLFFRSVSKWKSRPPMLNHLKILMIPCSCSAWMTTVHPWILIYLTAISFTEETEETDGLIKLYNLL